MGKMGNGGRDTTRVAIMLSCVAQQDLHGIAAFFELLFFSLVSSSFFCSWKTPCCDLAPAHEQICAVHMYTEEKAMTKLAKKIIIK